MHADVARLGPLAGLARDWHAVGDGDPWQLPRFFGIPLALVDCPQADILGLATPHGISVQAYLRTSPLGGYVVAHEVSHVLLGVCADGLRGCGSQPAHQCEALAWCGAALFVRTSPLLDGLTRRLRLSVVARVAQARPADGRLWQAAAQLEAAAREHARAAQKLAS